MALIIPTRKISEVVHENYLLIPVINRLGIRLGFGDKTINAVCQENGVDADFFVMILNIFSNEKYFPEHRLQTVNIKTFIEYLRQTHQYYLQIEIPAIEDCIFQLIEKSHKGDRTLGLIQDFFRDYKNELSAHILREETLTFPYINSIYRLFHESFDAEMYYEVTKDYSMKRFSDEHDNIDIKLLDLKNLLIKYILGNYDQVLLNRIVSELFRLEKDIKDHTRLEEKILKPWIQEIENNLKNFVL
jgi:regulator of cell morphogenesis and NO signaling